MKADCSSTRGKAATVLASDVLKACKKNNSSVCSYLISKPLTHVQVFCSSKLVLQSHSSIAFTVQWSHLVFIRSELLPAAEIFVVLVKNLNVAHHVFTLQIDAHFSSFPRKIV